MTSVKIVNKINEDIDDVAAFPISRSVYKRQCSCFSKFFQLSEFPVRANRRPYWYFPMLNCNFATATASLLNSMLIRHNFYRNVAKKL